MNDDTRTATLPILTTELLSDANIPVDNLFCTLWKSLGFNALLKRYGFQKRSGIPVNEVVYLLLLWVWLKVDSIAMFSRDALQSFSASRKDVMYDLLKREDLNWRQFQLQTAKKVIHATDDSPLRAFVVDDTVKPRRGKKMPGVSSHYDHLTGRCIMGQQVLTLGLATEAQFVPLDNEIFISNTKAQGLPKGFVDGRSIAAKRYRDAQEQTKPDMLRAMIGRAVRADINASYFLSDSWFATKPVLQITEDYELTAVVRMKKNTMKYRITPHNGENILSSAAELYKHHVKGKWRKTRQGGY